MGGRAKPASLRTKWDFRSFLIDLPLTFMCHVFTSRCRQLISQDALQQLAKQFGLQWFIVTLEYLHNSSPHKQQQLRSSRVNTSRSRVAASPEEHVRPFTLRPGSCPCPCVCEWLVKRFGYQNGSSEAWSPQFLLRHICIEGGASFIDFK